MAEGSEHTNLKAQQHVLQLMGMDSHTLQSAGIPPQLVSRIYKALWVYSLGIHELITEVAHHARNNHVIIGTIFKIYAILLEDYQGEDYYVMALLQVEAESQRVLKLMEERFVKSLQLKQDNEIKLEAESVTSRRESNMSSCVMCSILSPCCLSHFCSFSPFDQDSK